MLVVMEVCILVCTIACLLDAFIRGGSQVGRLGEVVGRGHRNGTDVTLFLLLGRLNWPNLDEIVLWGRLVSK